MTYEALDWKSVRLAIIRKVSDWPYNATLCIGQLSRLVAGPRPGSAVGGCSKGPRLGTIGATMVYGGLTVGGLRTRVMADGQ